MASILLASAGSALGGSIGGSVLGVSAATIGGAVGQIAGSMVDSWIVSGLAPAQRIEGQRLQNLTVTTSTEGAVLPRVYGRMRIGGNIIWATDFTEHVSTTSQGGKGGGPKVTTTSYLYTASFAVALAEGPISGIGRVWADGKPLDLTGATWRLYKGDEAQGPDPFIETKMGAGNAPAYRGTAYVMFEELDPTPFGNPIPQLSLEVFRPLGAPDSAVRGAAGPGGRSPSRPASGRRPGSSRRRRTRPGAATTRTSSVRSDTCARRGPWTRTTSTDRPC